ncbi:DUF4097 domain-containing protein [Plantactinospora sp. GCM10030261]|uniref:DUF4097 family beta strand repeat-containing protein n=1 Tax=Plantactinospora sp. GCM10030261 TaxID=3273420 RepID=UPI0036215A59
MLEFPLTGPVSLVVKVPAGSIEVVAEERDSATVDIEPAGFGAQSREMAEQTKVDMSGDTLSVIAPRANGGLLRRGGAIRVRIAVPGHSSARIDTAAADVTCRGTYASLVIDGASSEVEVEHVTGAARIKTASGDVQLTRVDGDLVINCASGDARIRRVAGAVRAEFASGDLAVEEAGGDLHARTASGDIEVGTVSRGAVRLATASGDVGVGIRAGTGVWLDLNTTSGTVNNRLAMADSPTGTGDGGQLRLEVRTVSGDIEIRRAP